MKHKDSSAVALKRQIYLTCQQGLFPHRTRSSGPGLNPVKTKCKTATRYSTQNAPLLRPHTQSKGQTKSLKDRSTVVSVTTQPTAIPPPAPAAKARHIADSLPSLLPVLSTPVTIIEYYYYNTVPGNFKNADWNSRAVYAFR